MEECEDVCSDMDNCKGIEYFHKSGAAKTNSGYIEGDCMPNDTDKPDKSCNLGYHQMMFFKKSEVECPPPVCTEY